MSRRFIFSEREGVHSATKVITDTETGVQYLFAAWGNAGGMTVLVDRDGKPLLDKRYAYGQNRGNEYPDDRYI